MDEEVKMHDGQVARLSEVLARLSHLEKQWVSVRTASQPPLANPSPLGLLGFAIVSWLVGMLKILGHRTSTADGLLAGTAIFIGGIAQIIAGAVQFPKNNTHSATVFCLFGAHWVSLGFVYTLRAESYFPGAFTSESAVTYYILLTVTTFILWIPTLRMNRVLSATLMTVVFAFTFDAAAAFDIRSCEIIAGVLTCVAATLAFYMAALDLVNEGFGRRIFPVFPHMLHEKDYDHEEHYIPRLHYHKSAMAGMQV
jgi:uncharacterized protein